MGVDADVVEVNGWRWTTSPDIVVAIAAGTPDEAGTATWLRKYLPPPDSG